MKSCYLSQSTVSSLFSESCKYFTEGNIAIAESLLHFLIVIRKAEKSERDERVLLFTVDLTSRILTFFVKIFPDLLTLTAKHPGKVNLKPR